MPVITMVVDEMIIFNIILFIHNIEHLQDLSWILNLQDLSWILFYSNCLTNFLVNNSTSELMKMLEANFNALQDDAVICCNYRTRISEWWRERQQNMYRELGFKYILGIWDGRPPSPLRPNESCKSTQRFLNQRLHNSSFLAHSIHPLSLPVPERGSSHCILFP